MMMAASDGDIIATISITPTTTLCLVLLFTTSSSSGVLDGAAAQSISR